MHHLDPALAECFAALALGCIHREYPSKIAHLLHGAEDARPPRELTPAFYGCFDWHSAVHGHWLLARLARVFPAAPFAARARAALGRCLTPENIAGESAYLAARPGFERPYGLAWLLQLAAELREWDEPAAQEGSRVLEPLERLASAQLVEWIPKLSHPIRSGEHSQSAFAFGLSLDWSRTAKDSGLEELLCRCSLELYAADRDGPLAYEPSGHDFLSPCLAEADLLRRVLAPQDFRDWLSGFLPRLPTDGAAGWLEPVTSRDPSDGKLAHLDGLNLSRAWMLEGIASGLPEGDPRRGSVLAAAARHREHGLCSVTGEHYEGGHWLGSYAVYLETGRGLGRQKGERSERPRGA